jgi:hypothetical protein
MKNFKILNAETFCFKDIPQESFVLLGADVPDKGPSKLTALCFAQVGIALVFC